MSISCNPGGMDYPSWLTISGFVMAVLVFFMTHIFANLSENNKKIADDFSYYTISGSFVNILLFVTITGILCFIIDKEHVGAVLVTIVLIVVPIYWSALFIMQLKNTKKKIEIDKKASIMQPDLNKDESVTTI